MSSSAEDVRPVRLRRRNRAQRRLIRSVIERLARQTAGEESFGRVVRVVHATAPVALPMHVEGELAERRLLRACWARLGDERMASGRRLAAA